MQTIKKTIIILGLFMISTMATAKGKIDLSSEQLILSIFISGKYSKQVSQVYQSQNDLICKTELDPYFLILKENEKEELVRLSNAFILESGKYKKLSDCKDQVTLKLKNRNTATLCGENRIASKLVKKLSQDCGRY